jgi:hypothetical protein
LQKLEREKRKYKQRQIVMERYTNIKKNREMERETYIKKERKKWKEKQRKIAVERDTYTKKER